MCWGVGFYILCELAHTQTTTTAQPLLSGDCLQLASRIRGGMPKHKCKASGEIISRLPSRSVDGSQTIGARAVVASDAILRLSIELMDVVGYGSHCRRLHATHHTRTNERIKSSLKLSSRYFPFPPTRNTSQDPRHAPASQPAMPPQGADVAAAAAGADKPKAPLPPKGGLSALLGGGQGDGEEDCDVPACRTMVDVLKRATGAATAAAAAAKGKGKQAESDEAAAAVGSAAWRKQHCPLGKEALGDATWGFVSRRRRSSSRECMCDFHPTKTNPLSFSYISRTHVYAHIDPPRQLHSTAAYYPEAPTAEEQGLARALIQSVAAFYPCGYCRKDFQKSVKADPPR